MKFKLEEKIVDWDKDCLHYDESGIEKFYVFIGWKSYKV